MWGCTGHCAKAHALLPGQALLQIAEASTVTPCTCLNAAQPATFVGCGNCADRTHLCTFIAFCGIRPCPPPENLLTHPPNPANDTVKHPLTMQHWSVKCGQQGAATCGHHAVQWLAYVVAATDPATKAHMGPHAGWKVPVNHTHLTQRSPQVVNPRGTAHQTMADTSQTASRQTRQDPHNCGCTSCAWPAGPRALASTPLG
jgi:hypothetical protein